MAAELTTIHEDVFKRMKIQHFEFENELDEVGLNK
jgi:hypothetical protein